jgi:uncharacterized protein YhaN
MTASFGRLHNDTLELGRGLNIVEAANESGKSTWCAFIRAMLFGIDTSDRDRTGYLSDKTRYAPWGGALMEGEMELDTQDGGVTLRRTTRGKTPMREFTALYTGTLEPVPELTGANAGEVLTGATEPVFRRSAFIAQHGIRVDKAPELEKRINALISTGDETTSYTQADERLRQWLRRRKYNKNGEIPALETRLDEIDAQIDALERKNAAVAAYRREAERLEAECDNLAALLRTRVARQAAQARERAGRLRGEAGELARQLDAAERRVKDAPAREEIADIRGRLGAISALCDNVARETARRGAARDEYADADAKLTSSPAHGSDRDALRKQAAELRHGITLKNFAPLTFLVLLLLQYVLPLPPVAVITILAAIFVLSIAWNALLARRHRRRKAAFCKLMGVDKFTEQIAILDRYPLLYERASVAEITLALDEELLERAEAEYADARMELTRRLHFIDSADVVDAAPAALDELERWLDERARLASALRAKREQLAMLPEDSGHAEHVASDDALPDDGRSREALQAALDAAAAELRDAEGRYNAAFGELRALGDPAVLGSERLTVEARLNERRVQYAALESAIGALKAANTELSNRFSPMLTSTAEDVIKKLTGGRYDRLTFSKDFDIAAKSPDDTLPHDVIWLSAGTSDAAWLALRLALSRLVLPPDCPVVIDDALASFDDTRTALALEFLADFSAQRQIILFTCHTREARIVDGARNVGVVRL